MKQRDDKPRAPLSPLVEGAAVPLASDTDDWESELEAWDRALPIALVPGKTEPIDAPVSGNAATLFQSSTTVEGQHGPLSGVPTGPFDEGDTPTSGAYATLVTSVDESGPAASVAPRPGGRAPAPLLDSQLAAHLAIPTGAFVEGASATFDSYAALVTESSAPRPLTIFDVDPPEEEEVRFPDLALPEMSTALELDDAVAPVKLGPNLAPASPGAPAWSALAGLLADELAYEEAPARKVDLALAVARALDSAGDLPGARAAVETALGNHRPDSGPGTGHDGWIAIHRARLALAERASGICDDERAAESLARLALLPHPDQAAYRAVQAEWALERAREGLGSGTAAAFVTAAPEGLPRALADAELAWGEPGAAAAILAAAGHARGGRLGAALLLLAATRNEVARHFQAATEQRYDAVALDQRRLLARMGLLRDFARMEPASALAGLKELMQILAPSALKVALARWGARLCAGPDRREEAWALVADLPGLGPLTAALARDRAQLRARAGGAPVGEREANELLAALLAHFSHPSAQVLAARFACQFATDEATAEAALTRIEALRVEGADVMPLSVPVEEIIRPSSSARLRLRALRLWRDLDPARWFPAAYAAAAARPPHEVDEEWREIEARDPTSLVFLWRAAAATRAARFVEAAEILAAGAGAWSNTTLGAPLWELSAERLARVDVPAACDRLETIQARGADPAVRITLERTLRRMRDRARWMAYARSDATAGDSPARRASLILESCFWAAEASHAADDEASLDEALRLSPLHPVALGLALGGRPSPGVMADRYLAAAHANRSGLTAVEAAVWLSFAGELRQALELIAERFFPAEPCADPGNRAANAREADGPVGEAARGLMRRLAWSADDLQARAVLLSRAGMSEGREEEQPAGRVPWADRAAGQLAHSLQGSTTGDAGAAPTGAEAGPLARLEGAARRGAWAEIVSCLREAPPHEDRPTEAASSLAVEVHLGRSSSRGVEAILAGAIGVAPGAAQPSPSGSALLFRLFASGAAGDGGRLLAFEGAARVADGLSDSRSATLFLLEAARLSAAPDVVEQHLRGAVERDPTSAPAASAWRRWLVTAGRIAEAADAAAAEADALVEPGLRIEALVQAAALARLEVPPEAEERVKDASAKLARATAFLRRALQLAPSDTRVFSSLRDLYEQAGEHASLAELLAHRLTTSSNPFEMTTLHLARAELFAGPLGDRAVAKAELGTILAKEPHHARALARLADLEEEQGNHAAAELLMRRSVTERSPERLRDLFLRLGRIHQQHVPDPKRAVAAFSRVLHLDGKNREALDALSNLFVGLGDTRNATALTEQLLRLESAPAQRVVYHLRLGQVAERAGDQKAAQEHFRRAVTEAPLDLRAVAELARHLEKIHDQSGRAHVLDATAAELRAAVLAAPRHAAHREALASVLGWRGRPAAAAAVLELGALLGSGVPQARDGDGRRLNRLAGGALDDRLDPPGVPSSVRQLFRMLGPIERQAYRPELARFGADRSQRVADGRPPRDVFDRVASELGVGGYELYVVPPGPGVSKRPLPALPPLVAVPGKPPAIIVGASLLESGRASVRFAAARGFRLTSSYLDLALADGDAGLAAWLGGAIGQFVPGYRRDDAAPERVAAVGARLAKLLPRRARPELLPFALEASGELDVGVLADGIRDGANRVGLLACGSLAAALTTVCSINGRPVSDEALLDLREARVLLEFALSDEHDELARLLA